MKKLLSFALASALLLMPATAYASSDTFGDPDSAALIISGSEITSGKGFLKNIVWLTDEDVNEIADAASGEATYRLGLGDSFSEPVTYSTYENHGEPIWQYRRVCGLDLTELAKALGINTDQKMSITVSAPDGMSKTLSDAFSFETKRYSFGTDGVSSSEIGPILAMYESTAETEELGAGILPGIPELGADSPDRVNNIFGYGQTSVDEITNCFWVKDVNRLRYGNELPALTSVSGGNSVSISLSGLISAGIWHHDFGSVSATGIPLEDALELMDIKVSSGKCLFAVSSDGTSIPVSDISEAFLAWDALDRGKEISNSTALILYTVSGECLNNVETIEAAKKHPFEDMAGFEWAENAVTYLYRNGVVDGVEETRFAPDENIKRGDLVLMLDRAFEFPAAEAEGFADVPADSYYCGAITRAKALGIAEGDGDIFYPENNVTRQEAMTLVARTISAFGKTTAVSIGTMADFSDTSDIVDWAYPSVEMLVGAGIVNGDNGKIAPNDNLTRAEMAAIIYRTLISVK